MCPFQQKSKREKSHRQSRSKEGGGTRRKITKKTAVDMGKPEKTATTPKEVGRGEGERGLRYPLKGGNDVDVQREARKLEEKQALVTEELKAVANAFVRVRTWIYFVFPRVHFSPKKIIL